MTNLTKHEKSNNQRLHSLNLRREKEEKSKLLIASALKNLDIATKPKNHITFDSDSDETEINVHDVKKQPDKKKDVLGFESDSDNEEITLQPRFDGKFGSKLMEMQSKIGMDERFKVDERFVESGDSDEEMENIELDPESELKKNLALLQQVVGPTTLAKGTKRKSKMFNDPSKMRYDPSRKDQKELEVKTEVPSATKKKKKKRKLEEPLPEVDKTRFYTVNPNLLKESFGKKADESVVMKDEEEPQPFSLLAMMGRSIEESDPGDKTSDEEESRLQELLDNQAEDISGEKKIPFQRKMFDDDSSSGESDFEMGKEDVNENTETAKRDAVRTKQTFCMTSCLDARIIDGPRLFCTNKSHEVIREEWLAAKEDLVRDYKNKHRTAVRSLKRERQRAKNED